MEKFLELEGGYLFIAFVVLAVTLFVSTRPFFGKGAVKRGILSVGLFLAIAIGLHFNITTNRMAEVKTAFNEGQTVICESRARRKVGQSVTVEKSRDWVLEGDLFTSPNYSRPFHTARCILPIKKLKN
ncbi:hypothetical protein MNB_SV-12-1035 [hydrothermal vent metagenome]|uniref:Uncharacterized protein n=1 Tax=hydrothermal vent metagenome TaxID=652676 RepID=A0A1W1CE64_9ZZZZ